MMIDRRNYYVEYGKASFLATLEMRFSLYGGVDTISLRRIFSIYLLFFQREKIGKITLPISSTRRQKAFYIALQNINLFIQLKIQEDLFHKIYFTFLNQLSIYVIIIDISDHTQCHRNVYIIICNINVHIFFFFISLMYLMITFSTISYRAHAKYFINISIFNVYKMQKNLFNIFIRIF